MGIGSVAVVGPHMPIGSGTIRRHSFVGVGVALLEEVSHCGGGLASLLCSGCAQGRYSSLPVSCTFE